MFPDPSAAVDKRISHKGKVSFDNFPLRMLRNKEGKSRKDLRAAEGNCTRGCLSWGKCVEIFQWHPRSSFWTLGCALSLQDLLNTNKLIYWWGRGFPINVYWTVYHIYQNDIQIPSKFVVISIHKMPQKCWRCLRETHWTMVRFSSLFYRKQLCLHRCNLYQILNIYIKYIYIVNLCLQIKHMPSYSWPSSPTSGQQL